MEPRNCPYFGIIDDQTSHADFPYEGNACHRVKKPVKVALDYQESHCLSEKHVECPGYINGWEEGFPLNLRADYDPSKINIFQKILIWRKTQQEKLAQKKEQLNKRDLKDVLQTRLPWKKDQQEKVREKAALDNEPVLKEEQKTKQGWKEVLLGIQPSKEIPDDNEKEKKEPQIIDQEKKILQDEAALNEYLESRQDG